MFGSKGKRCIFYTLATTQPWCEYKIRFGTFTCKFYEIIFEVNLTLTTSFLPLVCSRGALNGVDGAASSPNIDAKYSCKMDC